MSNPAAVHGEVGWGKGYRLKRIGFPLQVELPDPQDRTFLCPLCAKKRKGSAL